jgi:hypothetical protein
MLHGWPMECLIWWSCRPERHRAFGQLVQSHYVAPIPERLFPNFKFRIAKGYLLERAFVPLAVAHLRATLKRVNPDIIWTIPHHWSIPITAKVLLSGATHFHLSIHDYPDTLSAVSTLGVRRTSTWASLLDNLYTCARSRDVISEPMAIDCQARTGIAPEAITRAGAEQSKIHQLRSRIPSEARGIRIAYAGTIIAQPEFSFFIDALRELRRQRGPSLSLHLYGSHSYASKPWFDSSWMIEHGELSEQDLEQELSVATWGFLPMPLTTDDFRYNAFSLPTKLAAYLSAGLPVIVVGHPESTAVKLLKTLQCRGIYFDNREDGIGLMVEQRFGLSLPREAYRTAILECLAEAFNASEMRGKLWLHLGKTSGTDLQEPPYEDA